MRYRIWHRETEELKKRDRTEENGPGKEGVREIQEEEKRTEGADLWGEKEEW